MQPTWGNVWDMTINIESNSQKESDDAVMRRLGYKSNNSLADFLSSCMAGIGFVLFIGGLVFGILLTLDTLDTSGDGYTFFEYHPNAHVGLPLIGSSLTFGLPFAAIGSYMSARLREMKN